MKIPAVFPVILLAMSVLTITSCRHNLRKELDDYLADNVVADTPGMAVMVVENGEVRYQAGAGMADLETRRPITPQTTFRMASVSKQFTAMGILLLEKQSKLRLDDRLSKYLPEIPPVLADSITLEHLVTHTSGIPDYETLMGDSARSQILDEDIPALLASQQTGYFPPGTQFRYSNTGFCLLALIVGRVSGQPYARYMREHIFEPLGMKNSFIYEPDKPVQGRGMGYAKDQSGKFVPSDQSLTSATKGDGCVYTSLEDYLKWYQALKDNKLINLKEKLAGIAFPFPGRAGEGYGLGWFFGKTGEGGSVEFTHSGSTSGFSNVILMVPEHDFLLVYFSNIADNHAPFEAIQTIVDRHASYHPIINWNGMHRRTF